MLQDISVQFKPGEMAYLMGPSGAGKSTLLDALSGRIKQGMKMHLAVAVTFQVSQIDLVVLCSPYRNHAWRNTV